MPKHFIKIKENFTCDNCNHQVIGTGYTNHCPNCLYSKHVDQNIPGDRSSSCQALMKPITSQLKSDQFIITHQCLKCQKTIKNKAFKNDNQKKLISLSRFPIKTKK